MAVMMLALVLALFLALYFVSLRGCIRSRVREGFRVPKTRRKTHVQTLKAFHKSNFADQTGMWQALNDMLKGSSKSAAGSAFDPALIFGAPLIPGLLEDELVDESALDSAYGSIPDATYAAQEEARYSAAAGTRNDYRVVAAPVDTRDPYAGINPEVDGSTPNGSYEDDDDNGDVYIA